MKEKRREIRRTYFPIPGLIIASVLGIIGIIIILLVVFNVNNYEDVFDIIIKNFMQLFFSIVFIIICGYCWMLFFSNVVFKPKKDILYLFDKDIEGSFFKDKKEKVYYFKIKDKDVDKYYYVLKTRDYIFDVLEECDCYK